MQILKPLLSKDQADIEISSDEGNILESGIKKSIAKPKS